MKLIKMYIAGSYYFVVKITPMQLSCSTVSNRVYTIWYTPNESICGGGGNIHLF